MFTKNITCAVLLSSLFVISIDAQIFTNGTVLRDDDDQCTEAGLKCSSDCTTLLVCADKRGDPFRKINCGINSPSTPYCHNNACSKSPGECLPPAPCMSAGVFPDPNNCTRFVYCDEKSIGKRGTPYECTDGFYNAKVSFCEIGKLSHHSKVCNTVDCTRKKNEVMVYAPNPAYFSFCYVADDGSRDTIMFKCNDAAIFDPKEGRCRFDCKSVGTFQDPTNCLYYHVCSRGAFGTFNQVRIVCGANYFFDGKECTEDHSKCNAVALAAALKEITSKADD